MDNLVKNADHLFDKCSFDYSFNNSKGIFTRADNYNFYKKEIKAIHFFSGLHSDYHKMTNRADKIDFENLKNRVHQISWVIKLLEREGFEID